METARLIVPIVSGTVGITVSLLLVMLLRKQPERDAGTKIGILLGSVVSLQYLNICITAVLSYCGIAPTPGHVAFSVSIASFLPALIVWNWRVSPVLQWRGKDSLPLVIFAFASGCLIATFLWQSPLSLNSYHLSRLLSLNGLICLIPAAVSILRLPLDDRLRSFMKVTISLYLCTTFISLVAGSGHERVSAFSTVVLLLSQTGILVSFLGSFILAARFRFADVFVRWSTRITVLGVLSIIATLSFSTVLLDRRSSTWNAVGLLACALETILLLFLGIIVTQKCERWVESHVLQRIDLNVEARRLHSTLFEIETRSKLFNFVEQELTRCLEVRTVGVLRRTAAPDEVLELQNLSDESFEIPAQFSPLNIGTLTDIDALIPVPSNGKIQDMIAISIGAGRRSLHSGEIRFLRELGRQLGVRLHQLELDADARRQALREALLRQQLTEAELRALRAQVNPHFLFNSLNMIADLIVRNPANAERMILRLSSVFRHVLAQSDRQFVSLQEEFTFLRNYLDIEQERFGDNLKVSLEMAPNSTNVSIPTLLLQPLVENALKHGIAPKGGKRNLRVAATRSADGVRLEVIDDGVGFSSLPSDCLSSEGLRSKSGVGLANTRARLRAVYGTEGSLAIESVPMKGSCVSISIPVKEVEA